MAPGQFDSRIRFLDLEQEHSLSRNMKIINESISGEDYQMRCTSDFSKINYNMRTNDCEK